MRAAKSAMEQARANGKKVGIFRPITIWPFPERELREICKTAKRMLVAEHNGGQILLEVERIVKVRARLISSGGSTARSLRRRKS